MRFVVAWRGLVHEKVRSVLATIGIFVAVLLIFMELGFFNAVPRGGMVVYDRLDFDILLTAMRLAGARAADQHDVALLGEEATAGEAAHQGLAGRRGRPKPRAHYPLLRRS
jgi:hypothetical protein